MLLGVGLGVDLLEGGLVDLVQQEQLSVGEHAVDTAYEEAFPDLEVGRALAESGEQVVERAVHAHVKAHKYVGFTGEVIVEGGLGEAHFLGDLAQGGLVVALIDKKI